MVSEIQTLMETNANITAENDALRKVGLEHSREDREDRLHRSPTHDLIPRRKAFIEEVIQPDLNAYAASLGLDVNFEFVIMDAMGQAKYTPRICSEAAQRRAWTYSSAPGGRRRAVPRSSYVNANKMLMISPSSTSPTSAIANDRFFRMCPADTATAPALADVIWSYGDKGGRPHTARRLVGGRYR